jgi:hypothetical protein
VTQHGSLSFSSAVGSPLPAIRHPGIIQRPVIRAAPCPASRCANIHDTTDARARRHQ